MRGKIYQQTISLLAAAAVIVSTVILPDSIVYAEQENRFAVTEDAFVHQNFTNTGDTTDYQSKNFGGEQTLQIIDIPNTNGAGDRMTYMKVDFSGYTGMEASSAKLNFYVKEAPSSEVVLKVEKVSKDWKENTITWNNRKGSSGDLGTVKISSAGWYSIDVTNEVNTSLQDKTLSLRFMLSDMKQILVKIASREDANNKPYLTIQPKEVASSNNANLASLSVKDGSNSINLSPAFSKDQTDYSSMVSVLGLTGTKLTITAAAEDSKATIQVNGNTSASGVPSETISIKPGDNIIKILVTAQDKTTKEYTLNIIGNGITIDSHSTGDKVETGKVRIAGKYYNTYAVKLSVNGQDIYDAKMQPVSGESGSWYYDLDTTKYDGEIELFVRGSDSVTRYGLAAPLVYINVDNAKANIPIVAIKNPVDGDKLEGEVPIKISVDAKNPLTSVKVRVNGDKWIDASFNGEDYIYNWSTEGINDKTCSIEAKTTDTNGRVSKIATVYAKVGNGSNEKIILEKQDRAMWIWESASYNMLYNEGSRKLLDVLGKDTGTFNSNPITTLYFGLETYKGENVVIDNPEVVRDFVSWAHSNGYTVYALIESDTGIAQMGAYERYHKNAVRSIEKIINYNISSKENERFDGVNVDVEPYTLPDFTPASPSLQIQYLDMLEKMIQRRDAAGINLPFGPAIAKWFDTSASCISIPWKGTTKPLSEHVQDITDYISIMDYRDSAGARGVSGAGIIPQAENEINYANKIGKANSVVIGVETLDISSSGDPETITFREEGRTYMEEQLKLVYEAFKNDASFGGIAMHHYDSIRYLPSTWKTDGVRLSLPEDKEFPTKINSNLKASAIDYQTIDLSYSRAHDNYEVEHYKIYRSTTSNFTPNLSNLAGTSRGLSYRDLGLLPNTRYYYKVAAVDSYGNTGEASEEVSAITGSTNLKPMIISSMEIKPYLGGKAQVQLKVSDLNTREGIAASIYGNFTNADGAYRHFDVSPDGTPNILNETITKKGNIEGWQVGFVPRRVLAEGYYWAQAYDNPHIAYLHSTNANLKSITINNGNVDIDFSDEIQNYKVIVNNNVNKINITSLASHSSAFVDAPNQEIKLKKGDNIIRILVTAQDGMTKKQYIVNVHRNSNASGNDNSKGENKK
jgi:hypothetical protein